MPFQRSNTCQHKKSFIEKETDRPISLLKRQKVDFLYKNWSSLFNFSKKLRFLKVEKVSSPLQHLQQPQIIESENAGLLQKVVLTDVKCFHCKTLIDEQKFDNFANEVRETNLV